MYSLKNKGKQFLLKKSFQARFENFLSSDLFNVQPEYSKTEYWQHHSKKIKYSIKNNNLTIEGDSGNYIPDRKNSFDFFVKSIKTSVKKLTSTSNSNKLSYQKAFDKIIKLL